MDKQTGLTSARRRHSVAFTGCAIRAVSAACLCALTLLLGACSSTQPIAFNEALRQELIQMRDADQRIRTTALNATNFHGILAVDGRHLRRMKEIVDQHGWPGKSLVGEDGSHAAWLLVQHATQDPGFMDHCRGLMEGAVKHGEASPKDYAFLVDRVRLQRGKMQLYGTQFIRDPQGRLILQPLKDPEEVDERRREMGLEPLAEYEAELRRFYNAK
jgi:hypothetical protein